MYSGHTKKNRVHVTRVILWELAKQIKKFSHNKTPLTALGLRVDLVGSVIIAVIEI